MAKRLTIKQKDEIVRIFKGGKSLDDIAKQFNCTKSTITRNLKKNLGENEYESLKTNNSFSQNNLDINAKKYLDSSNSDFVHDQVTSDIEIDNKNTEIEDIKNLEFSEFTEITPLNEDIENAPQKDLSSVAISDVTLPNVVYMVVDKKIELEIKTLNEYPEWQFLSVEELERKTIQIFPDLKTAKRFCRNEQKVIKVPNTKVFELVAPILTSRGISRIVSDKTLIAL